MNWLRIVAVAGLLVAPVACKKSNSKEGLPPASEWQKPTASSGDDPTAGIGGGNRAMGNNPHGMGNSPHGMDPGSGNIAAQSGMAAPDPNRPIDASKYLKGTLVATDKTQGLIKPNYSIFLSVKAYDPATKGPAAGPPLAVDKMESATVPAPFELTQRQAMVDGTHFSGDVVITVHVSQTGDAMSKVSGDIIGTAKATIPSDNIKIVLDQVIP